jgi:endonuclease/exonuclease/phosphatase (EEP) superfamily protein YafD
MMTRCGLTDAHSPSAAAGFVGCVTRRCFELVNVLVVCFGLTAAALSLLSWSVEPALNDSRFLSRSWAAFAFYVRTFQAHVGVCVGLAAGVLLVCRRWKRALVVMTCATILLSVDLHRAMVGQPAFAQGTGNDIRLFSMNLLRPNRQVDTVFAQIIAEKPDIICFQEFSRFHQERLDLGLLQSHPNRLAFPAYDYRGLAIYSRWPLELELAPVVGSAHERFMVVRVRRPGGTIRLVNLHPASPAGPSRIAENRAQVQWVIDRFAALPEPTILAGDFNSTLNSQQASELRRAGFAAAAEQAGQLFWRTWSPHSWLPPIVGIDHVFSTDDFTATSVRAMGPAGSDHRGISVVLRESAARWTPAWADTR